MYGSLILLHHSGNAARSHRARVSFRYGDYGATLSLSLSLSLSLFLFHGIISEIIASSFLDCRKSKIPSVKIDVDNVTRVYMVYTYKGFLLYLVTYIGDIR